MQASNPYNSPELTPPASPFAGGSRMLQIRQIDLLSAAKLLGCLYALLGLIIGGIFSLIALLGAAAGGGDAVLGGLIGGVGAIVIFPIIYGAMGFIGGAIGAVLYNLVARIVGGIRIDVQF